jgi:hypothetical protein
VYTVTSMQSSVGMRMLNVPHGDDGGGGESVLWVSYPCSASSAWPRSGTRTTRSDWARPPGGASRGGETEGATTRD